MKKNGFLLVELLISFSLSFVILIVIFNATISLNERFSDLYAQNKAYSQQIVFNRKIADDMAFYKITNINESESNGIRTISITYNNGSKRELIVDVNGSSISYNEEKIKVNSQNMVISNETAVSCASIQNDKYLVKLSIPIHYYNNKDKNFGIELYNIVDSDVCS